MIEHVNDMLYRTSKVTGKPIEEVLRGLIDSNMPMYGLLGAGVGVPAIMGGQDQ